jgi:hypothetical protein
MEEKDAQKLGIDIEKEMEDPIILNFIIFDIIKEFTEDLYEVYKENSELVNYREIIKNAHIIKDAPTFISKFKRCLNGRHRAKYCDGVYINIPEFLQDTNNAETIKESLEYISQIYDNPRICKEWKFCKEKLGECKQINLPEQSDEQSNGKFIEYLMGFFMEIMEKFKKDFHSKNLSVERVSKIPVIILYNKINSKNIYPELSKSIPIENMNNLLETIMSVQLKNIGENIIILLPDIINILKHIRKSAKDSGIELPNIPSINVFK